VKCIKWLDAVFRKLCCPLFLFFSYFDKTNGLCQNCQCVLFAYGQTTLFIHKAGLLMKEFPLTLFRSK
jgi:hypothetical protein